MPASNGVTRRQGLCGQLELYMFKFAHVKKTLAEFCTPHLEKVL